MKRREISGAWWESIGPLPTGKEGDGGGTGDDARRTVECIAWRMRAGAPGDMREEFGNWSAIHGASAGG